MPSGFQLGENLVLPLEGRIVGPNGHTSIQPRVMSVLMCLVAHRGEVVTRDQIFEKVWGNIVVTDDSLSRCISELRNALGDKRASPRYLKTIPKVGYRLVGSVEEVPKANSASGRDSRLENEIGAEKPVSDNLMFALVGIFEVPPDTRPIPTPESDEGWTLRVQRAGNTMMVVTNSPNQLMSTIEKCSELIRGSICAGDVLLDDQMPVGGVIQRATSLFQSASAGELRLGQEALGLVDQSEIPASHRAMVTNP